MAHENPLVSIGVPVYNEERYLSLTLDSLLSQDYQNLELIISDNASTDRTREICQEYVNRDGRVRYYRTETNVGAVENFNSIFLHARGKYFMWAGAHDLWDSTFVSRALSLLEADPRTVLVYSRTMLIDPDGHSLSITPDEMDTRGLSALYRYLKFIWTIHWCNMIHGLIRSEVIRGTGMFRRILGSDILLLAELSLIGEFAQIRDTLFYRRENRPEASQKNVEEWKERYLTTMEGSYDAEHAKASLPELFRELRTAILKVVANSELIYRQKLRAYLQTMICFRLRYDVSFPGDIVLMSGRRMAYALKTILRGRTAHSLTGPKLKSLRTSPRALKNKLGLRLLKKRFQRELRRQVKLQLANGQPLKLIVGAGAGLHFVGASASNHEGWLLTDESTLDALNPADWGAVFELGIIHNIMAEHVVEHWTKDEFRTFLKIAARFLSRNGNTRIAVPDGFHPDRTYIDAVKPGGTGPGADDHKVLYNYQTLGSILSEENWSYDLLEYFDERGVFHSKAWDTANGFVERSEHHDPRNEERPLSYTSLIVDLHPEPRSK